VINPSRLGVTPLPETVSLISLFHTKRIAPKHKAAKPISLKFL
jgi:hypothetical protein